MTSPTQDAAERAEFEKWAYEQEAFDLARNSDGDYDRSETHFLWQAWRARAALSAPQESGWHPISTAPKDCLVDIWIAPGKRWTNCYYDHICDEWRTTANSGHLVGVKAKFVTHWRPLPPPPGEQQEGQP
jgi:hypothetical protein